MYAVMNPDGTVQELREGQIEQTTNTSNRQKRYAVPYEEVRPALKGGEQHVLDRRDVTAEKVTEVFLVAPIPQESISLEQKMEALTRVLVNKGLITRADINVTI